jgi:hypothetical protein
MIQIYAIAALVAAAVLTGGGFYIKSLRAEVGQLTQAYSIAAQTAIDNKAELEREIGERARTDRLLLKRERERERIRKTNGDLNALLDNLKRGSADVRTWSGAAVPDGVRGLLNGPAAAAGEGNPQAVPAAEPDRTHESSSDRDPH